MRWISLLLLLIILPVGASGIPVPDPDRERDLFEAWDQAAQAEAEVAPMAPLAGSQTREGSGQLPDGVTIRAWVERTQLLTRDVFIAQLQIIDPNSRVREVALARPQGAGFSVAETRRFRETVEMDGRARALRTFSWQITPTRAGEQVLYWPTLTLYVSGQTGSGLRYQPQPLQLTVARLPAYWPEYVPVSPEIVIENTPPEQAVVDQPEVWTFAVEGKGLTRFAVAQLLESTFINTPAVRFGSLQLTTAAAQHWPDDPRYQRIEGRISITPQAAAEQSLVLPDLTIPYLDPEQTPPGRALQQQSQQTPAVGIAQRQPETISRAPILWLAALIPLAVVVGFIARMVEQKWWLACRRRAFLQRLSRCPDDACRHAQLMQLRGGRTLPADGEITALWHQIDAAVFAAQPQLVSADLWTQLVRRLPDHWWGNDNPGKGNDA